MSDKPRKPKHSKYTENLEVVKNSIKSYPNFPKPGVIFRDIFSVFLEPKVVSLLREVISEYVQSLRPNVEAIGALDSRGFLFGPLVALDLQIPFFPIRKKGKLPGDVLSASYTLEYGQDTFEMQAQSVTQGMKVVLIDDLLATGGSMSAACKLIDLAGGEIVECITIIEIEELHGRNNVPAPIHSFIQY